ARTTNGGATWTSLTIGTSGPLYAVGAAGTLNFWAIRGSSFQKSRDRGATFSQEFTDAASGIVWHASLVTSAGSAFGWAVTDSGKIYAYFNPIDFHDLSMVSLGTAPATRPNSRPATPAQTDDALAEDSPASADYATTVADGSDDSHDAIITLSPIEPLTFAVADTMRFRAIVKNLGTFNEPSYQLGWQIDGVAQTTINRGALASGALDTVILQWNQATTGAHTVRAWANVPDDNNRANDTATYSFVFSLDRGVWTSLPASPNALSRSCVAYIRIADTGYVYQFGGGSGTQLNSVARFNTVTNTWTNTGFAQMPLAVSAGTAITIGDSNIYVFGGENAAATLGSTQKYNVYTNTWTTLAPMPTPVTDAAVVKYRDSLVYVIGGGNGLFGTVVNSAVQLYNVRTNTYTAATPYPVAVAMTGAGIFNDTIIVTGGWTGTTGNALTYKGIINPADPTQITWTAVAPYPAGGVTRMASAVVKRGSGVGLLCAGGAINGATLTAKAYLWNFCTGIWSPLDTFAVPRSNMKAASDGGATAYVIAGFTTVGVGTSDKFTLTNIEGTCNASVGADSLLVILHDSTVGASTLKRKADRDTLLTYLRQFVPNHRIVYMADSNATTLPSLSTYKMILYQETSFDDGIVRYLGVNARQALKDWLNGGTPSNRRRLILIGADLGYNYSRSASNGRDTALAHQLLKFAYLLDNANVTGQNSITGVAVNPGQVLAYTTTPPGSGFYPDGCRPQSGGVVLYKYTGRGETDSVAGIGYSAPGYVAASLFQDPRYFTGTFGPVLASLLQFTGIVTDVEEQSPEIPSQFALLQNYPNPFNPATTIRYALPTAARVNLTVYNILGQRVSELVDEVQASGNHSVMWNGRNQAGAQVASGVYFYRLEARPVNGGSPFISLKKMILLK
ncbi:MAG TPA: kelch repeat-containing protein, partial [Bacteroidota bacterium]|nr:kelch repeat-containing protein [Bacteroidota bacterium]